MSWFQAVAGRDDDPAAFRMLLAVDPTFENAWKRAETGRSLGPSSLLRGVARAHTVTAGAHLWGFVRGFRPKMGRGHRADVWGAPVLAAGQSPTWTPELAITMGEISRLGKAAAVAEPGALKDSSAPESWTQAEGPAARLFGDATEVAQLFPTMALLGDGMWHHRRKPVEGKGLDVSFVVDRIVELETLRARFDTPSATPAAKSAWGRVFFADMAATLGGPELLDSASIPELLEIAYERRWHTKPASKSAFGAIVHALRERTRLHGDPRLLVVLAASSDGANRAAAGGSTRTPGAVYDKLIYDNASDVLKAVVSHPSFDNDKAYSMLDTGLAPQITAVMRHSHGNINIAIRVVACERAIAHPDVDPYQTYLFLLENRRNPAVPRTLWPHMIRTLMGGIAKAEADEDVRLVKGLRQRLATVAADMLGDVLVPYMEACSERDRYHGGSQWLKSKTNDRAQLFEAVLDSASWLMDPDVMDIVAAGFAVKMNPETLSTFLQVCNKVGIPIPDTLAIACVESTDAGIRQAFALGLPDFHEDDLGPRRARSAERLAKAREYVRDMVFENVIPNHVGIDGAKRELSRMHHHFIVANLLDLDTLVAKFVDVAEKDPRAIPDAFAQLSVEAKARFLVTAASGGEDPLVRPSIPRMVDKPVTTSVSTPAITQKS